MQIILLEKIANLGNLGDVVKVKDGFARNYLIPTRQARRATEAAIKEFADKRAELEKLAADKLAAAQALAEKMAGKTVTITQKAGVDGRLFGSVTNADVCEGLKKLGFEVAKSGIRIVAHRCACRRERGRGRRSRLRLARERKRPALPAFFSAFSRPCPSLIHNLAHRHRRSSVL
jgi:large subunit ribosomal protein L9